MKADEKVLPNPGRFPGTNTLTAALSAQDTWETRLALRVQAI